MKNNTKHSTGSSRALATAAPLTVATRLTSAIKSGKQLYGRAKVKTVQSAKATDKAVRANPYKAIGIAASVGVLVGCIAARRRTSRKAAPATAPAPAA